MSKEIEAAMNSLKKAMADNLGYAEAWHANIAVMCSDAIHDDKTQFATHEMAHRMGNEAASRVMKLFFDIDMTKL